jgi:Cupredoxin-like domain
MTLVSVGLGRLVALGILTAVLGGTGTALAEDPVRIDVTLKDHRFTPSEIHIPSGKRVDLQIRNEDDAAEEFESSALKIEKIVPAKSAVTVHLRPLGSGRFPFMGEFHSDTAKGVVIAD